MVVMRSIALGLDLQEDFFDDKIDKQCHNLRLLSYPPIKRAILDKDTDQARAGAHSGMHNFISRLTKQLLMTFVQITAP